MRRLLQLALVATVGCVAATHAAAQGARPQFRPAVFLPGEKSLVNIIDTAALMKAGQKDGAIMFASLVAKDGRLAQSRIYRGMPGTDALRAELSKRLDEVVVAPAIYNHQPVEVLLYGTVVFSIVDGKPRLRIFLHQDPTELKKESDFIGPQPVFGADSKFTGLEYPQMEHPVEVTGVVDLNVRVDATGTLQASRVIAEEPPLLGFGQAALNDFEGAKFIPAFRDGDPDASDTVMVVAYQVEF
jgi:hypothetical protein